MLPWWQSRLSGCAHGKQGKGPTEADTQRGGVARRALGLGSRATRVGCLLHPVLSSGSAVLHLKPLFAKFRKSLGFSACCQEQP